MQCDVSWKQLMLDIDQAFDQMVLDAFTDEKIHLYREAIRKFRAVLFFYMPIMPKGTYRYLEVHSKRYFDKTSLIRELDVFLNGYGHAMLPQTQTLLKEAKKTFFARLSKDARRMASFRFAGVNVRPFSQAHLEGYCFQRLNALYETLSQAPLEEEWGLERHIHSRRMLAKKIRYIHDFVFIDQESLVPFNRCLETFQLEAKKLHDVCVNLRLVGQYAIEDPLLIEGLVHDHVLFQGTAQKAFACVLDHIEKQIT